MALATGFDGAAAFKAAPFSIVFSTNRADMQLILSLSGKNPLQRIKKPERLVLKSRAILKCTVDRMVLILRASCKPKFFGRPFRR